MTDFTIQLIIVFIACALQLIKCGYIKSWDIITLDDFSGTPNRFQMYFNLESGLSEKEYIQINFPDPNIKVLSSDLYLYESSLLLVSGVNCINYVPSLKNYYCQYGIALNATTWYSIVMHVDPSLINWSISQIEPVEMITVSNTCYGILNCSPIIYDMNNYFGYLLRTQIGINIQTTLIKVSFNTTINSQTIPGYIYNTYLDITPGISYYSGAIYTITINPTTTLTDPIFNFKFGLSCFSDILDCQVNYSPMCTSIPQIQNSTCSVNQNLNQISFQINQPIFVGQTFRINVQIYNPLSSPQKADIRVHGQDITTQRTTEKGVAANALQTQIIQITKSKFNFMWGMSQQEQGLQNSPYKLFSSVNLPTVNSVYISFQVNLAIPIGQEYKVLVCLGKALGIIENSIVTNLPALNLNQYPLCYQQVDSFNNVYVACEQVGALIQQNQDYFVSVKVSYASTISIAQGYGGVQIFLKNYPSNKLYNPYPGENINIKINDEFYDVNGFSLAYGLGTTQIVSYTDSEQYSAVPNAVENFLSSDMSNTVGIIPSDVSNQLLLFFLKVDQSQLIPLSTSFPQYMIRMNILYNPNVIIYEQGYDQMGLDFAAFQTATASDPNKWTVDQIQCYNKLKCSWYNQQAAVSPLNYLQTSPPTATVPYNIQRFECISTQVSDCNNWRGFSVQQNGNGGVFAMRRIKFRTGFHSQLQADDDLLDFVIWFDYANYAAGTPLSYTVQSAQLINAYTIQLNPLKTSKISYINFSENSINPGHRFPTFLRVGGSIAQTEYLGAPAIAVFFDESVELKPYLNFYNPQGQAQKDIGCSANNCYFYNSNGISGKETWMNYNMVLATGLTDIENDFNLLIPIQNKLYGSQILMPKRLVVAFCDFSKTSNGVPNQLRIVNVFRVYGAPTYSNIANPISPIFSAIITNAPLSFTSSQWSVTPANQSQYKLDMTNVQPLGTANTSIQDQGQVYQNHNNNFNPGQSGAGVTISSLYYNVFGPSTLGFTNPPFGVSQYCTKFNYIYNDIIGQYPDQDKFTIYNVYCPIDAKLLGTISITWINPFFSYQFAYQLQLTPIFMYSFSSGQGKVYSYQQESQSVATYYNTCIVNQVMNNIYPMSVGKQAVDFSIQINAKTSLDPSSQTGYGFLVIQINFSVNLSSLALASSVCDLNNYLSNYFTCSVSQSTQKWQVVLKPTQKYLLDVIEYLLFTVYVDASSQASVSGVKYDILIYLPTQKITGGRVFGNILSTPLTTIGNFILFSQCLSNNFLMSTQPYLKVLTINNLQFEVKNANYKSPFNFTFSSSPRERFYSTSFYSFDFGFLIAPYQAIPSRSKFIRCSVYEAPTSITVVPNDQFKLSWRWSYIVYNANLRDIRIYPKTQFRNPDQYIFTLKCLGTYTPSSSSSTFNIQGQWMDGAVVIQTSQVTGSYSYAMAISKGVIDPTILSPLYISLFSKLFNQQGFESSYTFFIKPTINLNYYTRIYINFPYYVGVGVNREVNPECYTRVKNIPTPIQYQDFKLAYCELINDNRLVLWFNQNVYANIEFHIVIHGISQPELKNKDPTASDNEVWIGIDDDAILSNGIKQFSYISTPRAELTVPSQYSFIISSVQISNTLIRSVYNLNIAFDVTSTQLSSSIPIYLQLPSSFSNNQIGQVITCTLIQINTNTVLSNTACVFFTQRLIKITFSSVPTNTWYSYKLLLEGIYSPQYIPEQIQNYIRLYLFQSPDLAIGSYTTNVVGISLIQQSNYYSFTNDTTKIDLIWFIYGMNKQVNSTNINMIIQSQVLLNTRTVIVNIGYYSKLINLQPANNQTYLISFGINLSGFANLFKLKPATLFTIRGSNNIQFTMGALTTTAPGIYSLSATKINDNANLYSIIPNLKVIVSSEACQINARQYYYEIPVSGISLPIELDFYNCMPLDNVIFTPLLQNTNSNNLDFDQNYLINKITGTSNDSRMYFLLKDLTHNPSNVNLQILLTFQVSGVNQLAYLPPSQITIKYISQNNVAPLASPITILQVLQNSVSLQIQCNQPGMAFWVIGIDPSTQNIAFNDILNIVTGVKGLQPTVSSYKDLKQKIYGVDISYINQPIYKTFDNLKANTYYSFKYYCQNQNQLTSVFQSVTWKTLSNGSYLLKITFFFNGLLTFQQTMQITCSIQKYFTLPSQRVLSDKDTHCNQYPNYKNFNYNNRDVRNPINANYPYMYYILPDYTIQQDNTNFLIKQQIIMSNFINNFIPYLPSSSNYPQIVSVQTQDNIFTRTIDIAVAQPKQVFTTTALTYLKLKNLDGFIIVGIEQGKSNTSPSPDQIKKGLNFYDQNLFSFEMRYCQREVIQEFKFIQLQPGTDYTAYFIGSVDDPSSEAEVTQPIIISFTTQDTILVVQTINAKVLNVCFVFLLLIILQ
ncbi:eukaryotic aspartyl protease family protein (macronuclear) [Tetrahymena thermophila SB210]|uniref:Eukaryotic aspartyl protease family protein n=1 Tax=Tetrahymena thermophila (strain SB210) TaxID=312017 RepID=Q23DQ3_TETTS|nr:eukaryotic aspartyl protease family protein [Tetrahymena thermophila SB210]EAR94375.3 eukaryotic aspartyl protease family protein [Tetrahymena thermophila SB210]|eukprot:XP_001014633.3 eukaryotic aspartyl protease family protein [Tetrahymena thermophila SB210]